jgi:DNA recombination protein RmuC
MEIFVVALVAIVAGLLLGWFLGSRGGAQARADAATREADFKRAIVDLAVAEERARAADQLRANLATIRDERDVAKLENIELRTHASGFEARLTELREAKDLMATQFAELSAKALGAAQESFLKRADERFRQSEETAGQNLRSMLQPVSDRLLKYEEAVTRVETDRISAFDQLKGQLEGLRVGQEKVSSEAAKLVNSLRNAPKSRGRWGEQQLKNVLETCGLSEHTDFQTEVSVAGGDEGGRLRPDAIVRVPGGRALVIDAKVSLNAYQDAFGAVDEGERNKALDLHAASMRAHVNSLANKAYWNQFAEAPDYVIMFIPGEHFLTAALEQDGKLWDFAFERRVLLATPTNLIAIARTVAAVWRQEKLADDARRIGELGKEMVERLAVAADHMRVVGGGLNTAVDRYNKFVGSFERNVLSTGRKFQALNIEPTTKQIPELPPIEVLARHGETPALIEDLGEAAE